MTTEKMREEFESWACLRWGRKAILRINHPGTVCDGDYEIGYVDDCWDAWQASRAAVVVELPSEYDCCGGTTSYEIRELSIEAVEAAGLKVKP